MINTLKLSFKIDFNYAINSFIYNIKKTPIIKNIITANLYNKLGFKTFIRILAIICTSLKLLIFRLFYFMVIYYIAKFINKDIPSTFIHIVFIFSIIGMFINTFIMSSSRKKYIAIMLFNMDAKNFILSHYYFNSIINFIINNIFLFILCYSLKIPIYISLILSLFSLFSKNIGESLNIFYYKKNKEKLLSEKLYFLIIVIGIIISLLPIINIYFYSNIVICITVISLIITIFSFNYIRKISDYKLIYKKINALNSAENQGNTDLYSRQLMVNINDKDKVIPEKKLKGKKGYDLFNTIFFERHKNIVFRSAKISAILSFLIVVVTIIVSIEFPNYSKQIHLFLINNISWFVIIMYFLNKGAIVTQAMFFNCDHSMLTFNFYKEPKVITELFKKRLITLIKINLIPAIIIAIGLPIILFLTGGINVIDYLNIFIFIICTCIFFSVHYLVIYYLLQPYNKDMKMKNPMYSIISAITYFCCYILTKVNINLTLFCILAIIFTISYIFISLILVYKKAFKTFKLK